MKTILFLLLLISPVLADDQSNADDRERNRILSEIADEQAGHNRLIERLAERERACAECVQRQLANPMNSLNAALITCSAACD